ncbi:MAG: flavodoxin family protein [Promethearchaeota archaeon]
MVDVLAINGSPRTNGNTRRCLGVVLEVLEREGFSTELVQLRPLKIDPCDSCYKCAREKDGRCHGPDDDLNGVLEKILRADCILLGSPTYFAGVSSKMKSVIDRAGLVCKVNGDLLKHKVGAPVVAARRQGACSVYSGLVYFFGINGMFVVGSSYWNLAIGRDPGDVERDEEGMATLRNLGENVAWLLRKLRA